MALGLVPLDIHFIWSLLQLHGRWIKAANGFLRQSQGQHLWIWFSSQRQLGAKEELCPHHKKTHKTLRQLHCRVSDTWQTNIRKFGEESMRSNPAASGDCCWCWDPGDPIGIMAKREREGGGGAGWRRCTWKESWGDKNSPLPLQTWSGGVSLESSVLASSSLESKLRSNLFFQLFLPYKHQLLFSHPSSNNTTLPNHPDSRLWFFQQRLMEICSAALPSCLQKEEGKTLKCQSLLFLQPFPGSSSGFAACVPTRIRRIRFSLCALALSLVLQGKKAVVATCECLSWSAWGGWDGNNPQPCLECVGSSGEQPWSFGLGFRGFEFHKLRNPGMVGVGRKLVLWVSQGAHPAYPWAIPWGVHTTGIPWQQEPGLQGRLRKKTSGLCGLEILPERLLCGVYFVLLGIHISPLTTLHRERLEWPPAGLEVGSDQLKFIKRTAVNVNHKAKLENPCELSSWIYCIRTDGKIRNSPRGLGWRLDLSENSCWSQCGSLIPIPSVPTSLLILLLINLFSLII